MTALVVAHRGASAGHVDNSLEAFEGAIVAGADAIEFDVRRTADDQLITFHDGHVRRKPVADLTRAQIGAMTGHTPPLLAEVIDLARGRIGLDVELKEAGYVDRVLAALGDADPDADPAQPLIVTSFLDAVAAEVKERAPQVRTGLLVGTDRPGPHPVRTRLSELSPVARARACGADAVGMHLLIASLGALERTHAAGLGAFVWTVNREDGLRRFLADPRVEAVITDVPARALAVRAAI
ncbi:tail fiber protein [Paraconexibacter sp. AEG42_29]|uniref:Tail fiber protein n=1 Tax=Paraconexibacter sp. AEG42_29 TaxID=2997339 RepID=A0AAU7ANV0_9ACTN